MNGIRTAMLLAALTALFLGTGYLLGGEAGAIIALVIALGTNAFAFWNSADLVLRMHRARQVTPNEAPGLHAMVAQLSQRAGIPTPRIYLIETDQPNAFATGRSPAHAAVAVTSGIMRTLDRNQLAGVIAHELAHIRNRDTLTMTAAATIAGAIGFLSQFALFFGGGRDDERPNPLLALALMILAPLAAGIIQMAISRTREFAADREGAAICGQPLWLAQALERIEGAVHSHPMPSADRNPASAPLFIVHPLAGTGGLANLFRTHPPTAERVARLVALSRTGGGSVQADRSPFAPARARRGSVPRAGGGWRTGR